MECSETLNLFRNIQIYFRDISKVFRKTFRLFRNIKICFRDISKVFRDIKPFFKSVPKHFDLFSRLFPNIRMFWKHFKKCSQIFICFQKRCSRMFSRLFCFQNVLKLSVLFRNIQICSVNISKIFWKTFRLFRKYLDLFSGYFKSVPEH